MTVELHPLAVREYRRARTWYARRTTSAALRFVAAVDAALTRLVAASDTHPVVSGQYRWIRVRGFPFRLIYRHAGDDHVMLVAVAHTSRRPGYWGRRK